MDKTNNNKKEKEWVNIRVSPTVKYALMEFKGKMKANTYDEVLRILIMEKIK